MKLPSIAETIGSVCDIIALEGWKMARCSYCGRELAEGETICRSCGTSSLTGYAGFSVTCILGFCLGAVFPLLFFLVPRLIMYFLVLPIAGFVISIVGTVKCDNPPKMGKALGISGIVINSICLTMALLVAATFVLATVFSGKKRDREYTYPQTRITSFGKNPTEAAAKPSTKKKEPRFEYTGEVVNYGPYEYQFQDHASSVFCASLAWYWSGDPTDNVIEMDRTEYGTFVRSIGNPCDDPESEKLFEIRLEDENKDFVKSELYKKPDRDVSFKDDPYAYGVPEGTKVTYGKITFTVKLGYRVCAIRMAEIGNDGVLIVWNNDGSLSYYETELYFECDSQNEFFYAEDGVLFDKETDRRIEI